MDRDHDEKIRIRAHEIWESEGRPDGSHSDHWSRAEAELKQQLGSHPEPASTEPDPQLIQAQPPAKAKRTRKPAKPKAAATD